MYGIFVYSATFGRVFMVFHVGKPFSPMGPSWEILNFCTLFGLEPVSSQLGGGLRYVLFSPLSGEIIQFDEYFSSGWFNHQLAKHFW